MVQELTKAFKLQPMIPTIDFANYIAHMDTEFTPFQKVGYNPSITGANEEAVWTTGGAYVFPAAAAQREFLGGANDDSGGSGILTARIDYLDASYVEHSEDITLNGTTVETTTATNIFRINDVYALTAGATNVAHAAIQIRHLDNTVYAQIAAGESRSRSMVYTVPDEKELYIQGMIVSSGGTTVDKGYVRFTITSNTHPYTGVVGGAIQYPHAEFGCSNMSQYVQFPTPLKFNEHADIVVTAIGSSTTDAAQAACSIMGFIESE